MCSGKPPWYSPTGTRSLETGWTFTITSAQSGSAISTGSSYLRCGGREEYDAQYSAASLYEGGWRSDAISDLIEQFNLTGDEAERIYNELLEIEQKAEGKEG